MKRIEDTDQLFKVQYAMQHILFPYDNEQRMSLKTAHETGVDNLFFVECSWKSFRIDGFLLLIGGDGLNSRFFPDSGSMVMIVGRMIDQRLTEYNAHKDWRFRGV